MKERYDFIIEITKEAGDLLLKEIENGFDVFSKNGDYRNV